MMETNNEFQKRYETENFIIKTERLHFGEKDTDLKAKVYGIGKDSEQESAMPSEIKFSSRQISRFAKNLCKAEHLDPETVPGDDEEGKTYKDEVESLLISKKGELTEIAKERQQHLKKNYDSDGEEGDDKQSIVNRVVKRIYQHDGNPSVDEFADIKNFNELQEVHQDLILRRLDEVLLTKKGEKKAEELLDITYIDDVEEEAEKVLEDNPLNYYLDAIDEVHKGDEALKIWELISALSAKCSERQIDSWAVGASVRGDTPVFVKKEDGWHIESIRQLAKEYDGQNWKTIGLNNQTLEAEETDIQNVLEHRNRRELIDVETRSGREISATADHSFLKHKNGEIVSASGDELEEGDYIPVLNGNEFYEEDQELGSNQMGYLLGIYLAEGRKNSSNRVHITNEESTVREIIKRICREEEIDFKVIRDGDFSIESNPLLEKAGTGSGSKIVPPEVFRASKEFQREVLKGYFDGDGISGDSLGFTTKSKDLGLGISMMLSQFNIITTHRRKKAVDWTEDNKNYYYRHGITKPVSAERFFSEVGFRRDEKHSFEERDVQQYVDRIPVENEEIKRFLNSNKLKEETGRNEIIRNGNVMETGEIGSYKLSEAIDLYDYDQESSYVKQLRQTLDSDIFWDKIESIEREGEKNRHRVYDIVAGKNARHFLLANGAVVHNSGSGKSHIKRAIIKFLPHGAFEAPNSMTPKAMLYKTQKEGSDYYKGKLLFLDEAEGYDSDDAVVLLRGLTDPDEDAFEHEIVKDQEHHILEIQKPVTVWFTSVESIKDEQLKNRFILTNPDGSEELDNIVFEHQQINLHTGQELGKPPAEAAVVKEIIAKIRSNTAGLTPIVPFKVDWKQKFNRRLYPYFVTLMEIIAKINHQNRVIKDNYIYVTKADFRTAAVVWSSLIDTTIAQTDTEALKLIMELPNDKREAMRTSELANRLDGFNTDKVRRKADSLRQTEELQLINAEKEGGIWEYWAGRDRDRLVNPEPDIVADEDTMTEILEKSEKGADQLILQSVFDAEVPVYDRLKEQQDEAREAKMHDADVDSVDLDKDEKTLLRLLEDLDFSTDLKFAMSQFEPEAYEDAWDVIDGLEDRAMIKVYEEDGSKKPKKTRTYRELREEGKIVL